MTAKTRSLTSVLVALLLAVAGCANRAADPANAANDLVRLVDQMTLDEKLAQLTCVWMDKAKFLDSSGNFDPQQMEQHFPHGVGCIARPQDTVGLEGPTVRKDINDSTVVRRRSARTPADTARLVNDIQRWMIEQTRLGIPVLFHEEGLHGFQGRYATAFPQAIALASTFDPELIERVYEITAREIRVRGVHHVLSPVVDIALDPRWGRIEETFGEDPFLVSRLSVAAVRGFQGKQSPIAADRVLATLKHMTGHGQPQAGMNVAPAHLPERVLREMFFPPFEAAVTEAKAASVMASYNEIDGIPSHANPWLLNDVLRGEWGFDGVVVADYFAVNELQRRHRLVESLADAGALAIASGIDMELPDGVAFYEMKSLVGTDTLPLETIDRAVERVLKLKARGDVINSPYADPAAAEALTGNAHARAVALEAAIKSPVLLKNHNNLLPLADGRWKTIAVIGPNSDITVLGGYSDEPRQTISILEGMRNRFAGGATIVHAKGVELTDNRSWWDDDVRLASPEDNQQRIEKAVEVASKADLIILAIGGDESTSREAWSETHMGDRDTITLIGQQLDLVKALARANKPMVGVVISGRPLALENVDPYLDAILYGWILGQETGTAVAALLAGDASPGGKMPVTVPRSVGRIPAYYYRKPTAARGYAFSDSQPLYPFGFGLSYSRFELSEPVLSDALIGVDGTTTVSVSVTNTGNYKADEVVQLYIRDDVSTVTRPILELKGFQRITLAPGQAQTVSFPVSADHLQFYNRDMKRVVEPGTFTISVGSSSDSLLSTTLTVKAQP